ncbi:MAG: alpha/beta hydrolase [Clostridiales bacterium]|nr:alpha/beta hydrolase [Clostridiales bacterium]
MPSKKFQEYQKNGGFHGGEGNMPPPGMPCMPEGGMEGLRGGVPMMPPDWTPPEPSIPEGYDGGTVTLRGVKGLYMSKAGLREKCAFLHIHGGGFTIGTAMTCSEILRHFIENTGMESYSVEYGLAPKHPFPEGVEDCVAFYLGLLDMGYERIIVGGESAGAGLTLSLTLALKERGLPLPTALWCSSPIDDIEFYKKELYMKDMFVELGDAIYNVYAPGTDKKNPLISPIYGDFSGFPPLLIQTGGEESLAAGAVRLAAKAAAADVDVTFHYGKGMAHTYAMEFGVYPEATFAMKEITTFINNVLDLDAE